jgi:hypothetical protein
VDAPRQTCGTRRGTGMRSERDHGDAESNKAPRSDSGVLAEVLDPLRLHARMLAAIGTALAMLDRLSRLKSNIVNPPAITRPAIA